MNTNNTEIQQKLIAHNCCVIIPTYNNSKTLERVINGAMCFTKNIIVVNDGCTDNTKEILKKYSEINQIHLPKNKGKGNALYIAILKAAILNFNYAISIDSDGQHYPTDIPKFIDKLEKSENKNLLIVGARNLNATGMPKKNTFANKFSNFWYWAETGKKLYDTQCGFRLYPVKKIAELNLITTKYEFEIEVIVKASWSGIEVKNIPINVLYDDKERVSHFRPFKDFARISLLNTYLITVALLYIKPRDLIRKIKKKGLKKFFKDDFLSSSDSNIKKSLSVSLGTFIGLSPFWGFQTFLAIFLASIFKLNRVISFAFSNISIPPFIPFIIYISLKIGGIIIGKEFKLNIEQINNNFNVKTHLLQYIIGSFTLATGGAILLGIVSYIALARLKSNKK